MKKALLGMCLWLTMSCAHALDETYGFSASSFSGGGLSYRHKLDDKHQLKYCGFIFGSRTSDYETLRFNFGGEFQRTLHQTEQTRFYGLVGGSYWLENTTNRYAGGLPGSPTSDTFRMRDLQLGVGIGIEILVLGNVSANFDSGLKFQKSLINSDYSIGLGMGVGVGYTF